MSTLWLHPQRDQPTARQGSGPTSYLRVIELGTDRSHDGGGLGLLGDIAGRIASPEAMGARNAHRRVRASFLWLLRARDVRINLGKRSRRASDRKGDRLLKTNGTIAQGDASKHHAGEAPLLSTGYEHLDRAVRVTGWGAPVLTVSDSRAISFETSYTFWRFAGIMRIRSFKGGCKWKPEFSAAEMSSG